MDKVKRLLGIKKDKKEKKTGGAAAAPQPAPLAVNMEDLAGSKKASHGVGGSAASHKAHGGHHHHHAHDAFQSKSASKGVGSSSSMIANGDLGSMGSMAASEIVGVPAEPGRTNATDQAWRQEAQIPSAKPAKRSEVAAKGGFVNPDGTRLTKDDVNMMKVMLTQVLESYPSQIEKIYSNENLEYEKNLLNTKYYKNLCVKLAKGEAQQKDKDEKKDYEKRSDEALVDTEAKRVLLSNIRRKLSRLSSEIVAIHKGAKAVSASDFLENYVKDVLSCNGQHTQKYKFLLSKKSVSDFQTTLDAVSAEFDAHKDEELEGIAGIQKYNPKQSKKLAGGRMQGSSTLDAEIRTLFSNSAKFRVAINEDDFIKEKNGNNLFSEQDVDKLMSLVTSNNDVANSVLAIIERNKLSSSAKSVGNFSKAAGIASKHAQKLKSKSAITFSDLMLAYMEINAGVGDQASKGEKSNDGKLKAQSAGTSSGSIVGPSGDTISADLFLMFNFAAKTMNEIKAIQETQPNVAKSRAVKLAGIVNSMTVSAHTFVNGNGRTCRLLADVILESVELPPASVNATMTGVGGLFGQLYANDDQKADGEKDFDRSTKGYLEGVMESNRLLQSK